MPALTPKDVKEKKAKSIPEEVLSVVNDLLVKNCGDNGHAVLKQDDIVTAIASKLDITRQQVFDKGWMDFEPTYRKAGWKVTYDKPAYNESYPATFEFQASRWPRGG